MFSLFLLDPSNVGDFYNCLKMNVAKEEITEDLLQSTMKKIVKADEQIKSLRALDHVIDVDYIVDLNFFTNS